jgi:hypothetical protein
MKIRPVGAEPYMRTEWRTDMTKAVGAFRDYANAPKMRVYFLATNWFRDGSKNATSIDQLSGAVERWRGRGRGTP